MGTRRDPGFGLAVPETRCNPDTLVASGTGNALYTQAGPIPGHPEPADAASRWRPQIRGAQSAALDVETIRGGYAGRDSGAATAAYRLAGETDAELRSWDEPNLVTDWTTHADAWGSSATWTEVTGAVLPDSHVLVVVARSSSETKVWNYNPRTEAWSVAATMGLALPEPIGMVYDEEAERLILFAGSGTIAGARETVAYSSSDGGATWAIYSRGMYDSVVNAGGPLKVASGVGVDWMALTYNGAATDQYASSDHGVTWQRVAASITGTIHHPIRTSSGWCVAYARTADSFVCVRLLGAARSLFADAAEIVVYSFAVTGIVGCRDYDGAIYIYATPAGGNTQCIVSYDEGSSWTEYESASGIREYPLTSAANQPVWAASLPAAGSIYNIGFHDSSTEWHAVRLGGWSNVEQATRGAAGSLRTGPRRFAAGGGGTDYVAYEFPDTYGGWTRLGAAGTRTMSGTDVGFEVVCTQAQVERYQSASAANSWAAGAFCHRTTLATSAIGGAAPNFNSGLCWEIVLDNGANRWTAYIEIGSNGIRVHGTAAAGTTTINTTSQPFHVRYVIRPNAISVWYRIAGVAKWTLAVSDHALTAAATVAATSYAIWGHDTAAAVGTSTLWTRYAYHVGECAFRNGIDTVLTSDDAYTAGVLGLAYGRRVPGRGASYPVPEATTSAEDMGHLTAVGGPTYTTEEVSLPVVYTYGAEHVHPDQSPSPRRTWRATDTTEVRLVYDQGSANEATWYGGAIILAALRATPRTIELALDDGAGGWTTMGTLDKGWDSINYTLSGNTIIPRTNTATIPRYFQEGELVGGYVVMPTGGTSVGRRILRQSAGYWTTDSTVQRMRITLEGIDGTETAAATCEIVHHSGVLVCYPAGETMRRYLRIRITSAQITPEGYYEAGELFAARVVGVGADPAWDWSSMTELGRDTDRAEDGTLLVRQSGPPRRVVEYGWPDGLAHVELRLLTASADYIGVQTGVAIGTEEDAGTSPMGLIEHLLRSGEVPTIVIPRLPTSDGTTITDPSGYLYGRLLTDAAGLHGIVGTEGTNEIVRGDSLAWEEIR